MLHIIFWLRYVLVGLSLGAFFVANKYLTDATHIKAISLGALFLIFFSIIATFLYANQKSILEKRQIRLLVLWQILLFLSLKSYFLTANYSKTIAGHEELTLHIGTGIWIFFLILGIFSSMGFEYGYSKIGKGENADPDLLLNGGKSWISIGLLTASLIALNYFGAEKDRVFDLSYLKASKPSEGTQKILDSLEKDLEITLFFQNTSEVLPLVKDYFDQATNKNPKIKLEVLDKDLNPLKTKKYKVTQDGTVIIDFSGRNESIRIGSTMEKAKNQVKILDKSFQTSLTKLTAKEKVVYLTTGHGEMNAIDDENMFQSISGLSQILRSQNISLNNLPEDKNLLTSLPADADVIGIIAPKSKFQDQEVNTLVNFLDAGGSLFITYDEEGFDKNEVLGSDQKYLLSALKRYGINFQNPLLAHNERFVAHTKTAIDKKFLYTNIFSSHEASQTLSKHENKLQVLFYGTGFFADSPVEGYKTLPIIKSFQDTYKDENGNYSFDQGEIQSSFNLIVGSESKKGDKISRIWAAADGHIFSDFLLNNVGNQVLILDTFKWITMSPNMATVQNSEEDVKIIHNQTKHLYVFYGSIFGVPSLLLLTGFWATRRKSRKR